MTTMIEALELSGQHIGKKVHIAVVDGPSVIDELVAVAIEERPGPDIRFVEVAPEPGKPTRPLPIAQRLPELTPPAPRLFVAVRLRRTRPNHEGPVNTALADYFTIPETQLVEVMD